MPSANSQKINAIRLSLLTAVVLGATKLGGGMYVQSAALFALAIDSFGDVLSSSFNYFFLSKSQEPADEDHHYGHGKFENFASLIQGLILVGSALYVIYRGGHKLIHQEPVVHVGVGAAIVILSFVVSFIVGHRVKAVGQKAKSQLVQIEAQHLLMDSYLYLVVLASLVFSNFGFYFVDPIGSFIVAGYILVVSLKIIKTSFDFLTDKALEESENEKIKTIIQDHYPTILGFDRLKTRRAPHASYISFRVYLCKKISLGQAHDVVDHIEKEIQKKISHAEVMIHPEPTKEDCALHEHKLHPRHFEI